MAGLFDVDKELARLNKQRTKIEKDLAGVVAKLNNPKFIEKASQVRVAHGLGAGGAVTPVCLACVSNTSAYFALRCG